MITNETTSQNLSETITEKNYPITKLWIFKAPIIAILLSLAALFFGYYFPYIIILIPYWLIANPLTRSRFHYSLGKNFLEVSQGVISKKQRHLPYGVIQTVIVKQDWFDRVFGLASLSIEDASQGGKNYARQQDGAGGMLGSSGNKIELPGLKKADAEALKLLILEKIKENPTEEFGL